MTVNRRNFLKTSAAAAAASALVHGRAGALVLPTEALTPVPAADFRDLGCKVWDANANQNPQWLANPYREGPDDLGDVYGVQWRQWPAYKVLNADASAQLADATARGFRVVTGFEEDGSRKVLLYKAIDQLRQ